MTEKRMVLQSAGVLLCVSGPSGVGKGTVIHELCEMSEDTHVSVSATTRAPRPEEREGIEYYFRSQEAFERMIVEKQILEYDRYCDHYYGTPRAPIEAAIAAGENVVLDITVKGSLAIQQSFPLACTVFLLPPSMEVLKERLTGRGTESAQTMEKRLAFAKNEITRANQFQYILVNENIRKTAESLCAILRAERSRRENLRGFEEYLRSL